MFKEDLQKVIPQCEKLTGKTLSYNTKAIKDLARNLVCALHESNKSVDEYLLAYETDNIIDPSFVIQNNVVWTNYVKDGWEDFCKIMFELRPVGLGTPNAMVGEAEFMLVFGSPRVGLSKVKHSGDITLDDKKIELKGSEMRIMGSVKGKEVQKHAKAISPKYNILPNNCNRNRTAYEPWAKQDHWEKQFNLIGTKQSIKYLNELCSYFISCSENDFKTCFVNKKFSSKELQKVILKGLWAQQTKLWDSYTVITEDKVSSLSKSNVAFNQLVNNDQIIVTSNYFRSFQDTNVGLYVELT